MKVLRSRFTPAFAARMSFSPGLTDGPYYERSILLGEKRRNGHSRGQARALRTGCRDEREAPCHERIDHGYRTSLACATPDYRALLSGEAFARPIPRLYFLLARLAAF